jgi:predicted nucleic acid-binding protein
MVERLYFDSCVLNRPTDDQTQERVRIESSAISSIQDEVGKGAVELLSSTVLLFELGQSPDEARRIKTIELLERATRTLTPDARAFSRAQYFQIHGIDAVDALHLALAEQAGATLLTVDDRLLRRAVSLPEFEGRVENPVDWLRRRKPWLIKR